MEKNKLNIFQRVMQFAMLSILAFSCRSTTQYVYDSSTGARHINSLKLDIVVAHSIGYKVTTRASTDLEAFGTKCNLASIPGAFFGAPIKPIFNDYEIQNRATNIDLSPAKFHENLIISALGALTAVPGHYLSIEPKDLKFARVATLCRKFAVGFSDGASNMLSLMYFDRAATISGKLKSETGESQVNLSIPKAGFYFIVQEAISEKEAKVERFFEGEMINLAVFKDK